MAKLKIKVEVVDDNGVVPSKNLHSDAGFDVTIIRKIRDINSTTALYGTGIKVQPSKPGFYFEMFARSSLVKSGYIITNSVGIIDEGYIGELMVSLTKVAPEAPDIQLPARVAQLIVKDNWLPEVEVVDSLDDTERGENGWGSSG